MCAERAGLPPLTVMPWSQFSEHPRGMLNLFEDVPNRLIYDPNKVFVGFDPSVANWAEKSIRTFEVSSAEQVNALRQRLMNVPILLRKRVVMKTERMEHRLLTRVRRITLYTEEFAVLINTQHPTIKHPLLTQLTKAEELLQDGKRFCISICLASSLLTWMKGILQIPDLRLSHQSDSDTLYLTNHTRPSRAFRNLMWCFTCPCLFLPWCLSYGVYRCVRNSEDIMVELNHLEVKILVVREISAQQARQNMTLGLMQMLANSIRTQTTEQQSRTVNVTTAEDQPSASRPTRAEGSLGPTDGADDLTKDGSYAGLRFVPVEPGEQPAGDPMEDYRRQLQRDTAMSQLLAQLRTMGGPGPNPQNPAARPPTTLATVRETQTVRSPAAVANAAARSSAAAQPPARSSAAAQPPARSSAAAQSPARSSAAAQSPARSSAAAQPPARSAITTQPPAQPQAVVAPRTEKHHVVVMIDKPPEIELSDSDSDHDPVDNKNLI